MIAAKVSEKRRLAGPARACAYEIIICSKADPGAEISFGNEI
jgi:hypothetical protein